MRHLSKCFCLAILTVGCATHSDSVTALKKWDDKYQECFLVNSDGQPFPRSAWFESLAVLDKKAVIGYLYNYNARQCIEDEATALKLALTREGYDSLLHIFDADLSPLESASLNAIKHLDQDKLRQLQKDFSGPFNLSEVVESLDLYD